MTESLGSNDRRELLYFPFIEPPPQMLRHAILYWDGITTIAPEELPDQYLSAELLEATDAGLARRYPAHRVWDMWSGGWNPASMFHTLNSIARSDTYPDQLGLAHVLRGGNTPSTSLRTVDGVEIFRGLPGEVLIGGIFRAKFPDQVVDMLTGAGLARWLSNEVLAVTPPVQTALVSIVAGTVADRTGMVPHTDQPEAWCLASYRRDLGVIEDLESEGGPEPEQVDTIPAERLEWQLQLGPLLPSPSPDTPLSKLIAFRHKYEDERQALVYTVDRLLAGLRRDFTEPHQVFNGLRRELEQALSSLESAAKSARLNVVKRSLAATVAVGAAAGAAVKPNLAWMLGLVSGYAVNIMSTRSTRYPAPPYLYLHRARKTFRSQSA